MNEGSRLVSRATVLPLAAVLIVGIVAARPRVVAAQEAETPQYRGLLSEAVAEYDARRYEEARALFRRAHDLSPNARTLRGIGMASFELREYVEALRALEGSLVDQRRPLRAAPGAGQRRPARGRRAGHAGERRHLAAQLRPPRGHRRGARPRAGEPRAERHRRREAGPELSPQGRVGRDGGRAAASAARARRRRSAPLGGADHAEAG